MSAAVALTEVQQREFARLHRECYQAIFSRALHLAKHRTEAEDLTQEAFVRAYRGFHRYDGTTRFENWMYRIVTNLFLDLKRKRDRSVVTVSYDAPIGGGELEAMAHRHPDDRPGPGEVAIVLNLLHEATAVLPRRDREMVTLIAAGETYREIASRLGISQGSITKRLERARRRLIALNPSGVS